MARTIGGPRKQRTRQHVIADQCVNHVERYIIDEGHTAQRVEKDYSYDLFLFTFDEQGYAEPGLVTSSSKRRRPCPPRGRVRVRHGHPRLQPVDGREVPGYA